MILRITCKGHNHMSKEPLEESIVVAKTKEEATQKVKQRNQKEFQIKIEYQFLSIRTNTIIKKKVP